MINLLRLSHENIKYTYIKHHMLYKHKARDNVVHHIQVQITELIVFSFFRTIWSFFGQSKCNIRAQLLEKNKYHTLFMVMSLSQIF